MQPKAIYRLCILIGISIIAYACSCSKKRVDYTLKGEFRYTNNLADTVNVKVRNGYFKPVDTYMILPYATLVLNTNGDYHQKKAGPDVYRPAIGGDTTTLYFNDTLCYSEYFYSGNTLHDIGSYTYDKRSDRDYVFYFNIDSALVKRAVKCK